MTRTLLQIFLLRILFFGFGDVFAQDWELAKEKDGIKVYTRQVEGSKHKAFKGETEFRADFESVSSLIEDVKKFDVWDDDITEIRVLGQEKGKMLKYYVAYDVPWPLADRDLCVEASIRTDPVTGSKHIDARSIPEAMPQGDGLVRIINYWQKWTIQPDGNGMIHLTVEGFADPAGDIPAWVANLAITKSPMNMLRAIREYFE